MATGNLAEEVDIMGMGVGSDSMFDLLDTLGDGTSEIFEEQYKTIQWHNGDRAAGKKYQDMNAYGGFFFPERIAFDKEIMLANGWVAEELTHPGSDESTPGYWKRELVIIPITVREAWQVRKDGKNVGIVGFDNSQRYSDIAAYRKAKRDGYERAKAYGVPSQRLQVLCLIEGMDEQGPVAITLGGSVARAFYDSQSTDNVLGELFKAVMVTANNKSDEVTKAKAKEAGSEAEKAQILKQLGKKWPMRAFRLPVGAARDDKGHAIYTTVGKEGATSDVTLPMALGLPSKGEEVDLNKWFVGRARYATVTEIFEEARPTWGVAWDSMLPSEESAPDNSKPVVATLDSSAAKAIGM